MTVYLRFDEATQTGRIQLRDGGVFIDPTLRSTVEASLFTDARIDEQSGYWAFLATSVEFGSLLWTLHGRKTSKATLALAERYAEAALAWMVTERTAASVKAAAVAETFEVFRLSVEVVSPTDPTPELAGIWAYSLATQGDV